MVTFFIYFCFYFYFYCYFHFHFIDISTKVYSTLYFNFHSRELSSTDFIILSKSTMMPYFHDLTIFPPPPFSIILWACFFVVVLFLSCFTSWSILYLLHRHFFVSFHRPALSFWSIFLVFTTIHFFIFSFFLVFTTIHYFIFFLFLLFNSRHFFYIYLLFFYLGIWQNRIHPHLLLLVIFIVNTR